MRVQGQFNDIYMSLPVSQLHLDSLRQFKDLSRFWYAESGLCPSGTCLVLVFSFPSSFFSVVVVFCRLLSAVISVFFVFVTFIPLLACVRAFCVVGASFPLSRFMSAGPLPVPLNDMLR